MHLRFKLTLLSAFVLTACSSGGNGGHHIPQAETPKVNQQQPQKKRMVEEQKQPMVEEQKQPMVEEQKQSMDKNLRKERADSDYFQSLSQFGSDYFGTRWVKLNLEGRDILLSPIRENIKITRHSVETLRDNSDQLIGYYGFASVAEEVPRYLGDNEPVTKHIFVRLFDIAPNVKPIEPSSSLKYYGKMYYHYVDVPVKVSGANVVADYNYQDKRFSMLISDEQMTWVLGSTPTQKYVNLNTVTESRNNIVGKLYVDNQPKGEFIGGLYGSQGEILAGEASSTTESGIDAWKGVVGANAKNTKE